jgi:CheY-like chemotaxis protein
MPKILIVDDNEDNRDSLSRRLQRRGYAIVTAADGNAGLAMARSEKPDLILMDMTMPELNGWEATRQIKAIEELRDVPFLALTAHALAGDRERAVAAGCTDYHTKPIDFPKLLAQMEAILQKRATKP